MLYVYKGAEANTPESEPIHFPDTDRLHDVVLFRIPKLEFEEMEVTPILVKDNRNIDEGRNKGSKRLADDDPLPGSSMKKSRYESEVF